MTWKEIKDQIEDAGVTDGMVMHQIDLSFDDELVNNPMERRFTLTINLEDGPNRNLFSAYN